MLCLGQGADINQRVARIMPYGPRKTLLTRADLEEGWLSYSMVARQDLADDRFLARTIADP